MNYSEMNYSEMNYSKWNIRRWGIQGWAIQRWIVQDELAKMNVPKINYSVTLSSSHQTVVKLSNVCKICHSFVAYGAQRLSSLVQFIAVVVLCLCKIQKVTQSKWNFHRSKGYWFISSIGHVWPFWRLFPLL